MATFCLWSCSGPQQPVVSQQSSEVDAAASSEARYPRPERSLQCQGAATEWPMASDTSQAAFCTMFAHSVALCEAPFESETCERIAWEDRRAAQLRVECMSEEIESEKLPYWIDSLLACSLGDDYDKGDYFVFPCPYRYPCWRSIGMAWTPAPDARSYPAESP